MSVISKKAKKNLAEAARTDSNRVHITPRADGWAIRKEGNSQASKVVKNQSEAIEIGKKWVAKGKSSAIIVHFKDGRFRKF